MYDITILELSFVFPENFELADEDRLVQELLNMRAWEDITSENVLITCGRWVEYEKDIALLSSKFPSTLFVLKGKGENSDDIWKEYFLNGKSQLCPARIIYDDFDEAKLVEIQIPEKYSKAE